mgnify:FL=1
MKWETKTFNKINVNNVYLIEGLPGMGNVGKIAIDFIIESLNAQKVLEIYSYSFPHCVFVKEDNTIEIPSIKVYQKKVNNKSFLFMAGDIQPLDEVSCYEFCDFILDLFQKQKINQVITLGGIGQPQIPKTPKVYCTGNDKKIIKEYSSNKVSNSIYGIVGPIIGVSGVLLGTSQHRNIPAVSLLTETYGHPTYLGIKGAKELLNVLNKKFSFKLNINKLNSDVDIIEKGLKKKVNQMMKIKPGRTKKTDINYIG